MVRILDATVSFKPQQFIVPLRLSSGTIESLSQATASVSVDVDGRRATGQGSVYLSDLWAWPDRLLTHDQRDAALRRLCEMIAVELPQQFGREALHPLELGLRVHDLACNHLQVAPSPSALARAMCASPFDAAIHDAAGLAMGCSAFNLYEHVTEIPSADRYFPDLGTCRAVHAIITRPRRQLPAWFIVSEADSIATTLIPAIQSRGYRCFKLKLNGRDNQSDVARTIDVYRAAKSSGVAAPRLTIDSNEANPSADSVLDYLEQLSAADREAYAAVEYLEQPTDRDILSNPFNWSDVTKCKPVMLDEGLTELSLLDEAYRQGYSGLALKTCKGHSTLLASAAWAVQRGMTISLQDLTNPGIALIHAALVGSHLPTINGAELNSPQFTPAANAAFLPRLQDLFEPRRGIHRLPQQVPLGLGSKL